MSDKSFLTSSLPLENVGNPEEMLQRFKEWLDNPFTKLLHSSLNERMTNNINDMVNENDSVSLYRLQGAARENHAILNMPDLLAQDLQNMADAKLEEED